MLHSNACQPMTKWCTLCVELLYCSVTELLPIFSNYEPILLDQEVDDSIEETIFTRIAFRTFFVSKWFNFCWWRRRFPFWLNPWPQTGHFIQFKITFFSRLCKRSKWPWSNQKLERYWADWNGTRRICWPAGVIYWGRYSNDFVSL